MKCEGIRNGVLQKNTKARLIEATKGAILRAKEFGLSVHVMETQRPSVKVVKAKSATLLVMRARMRGNSELKQVLISSIFAPDARKQEKHTKHSPNLPRKPR